MTNAKYWDNTWNKRLPDKDHVYMNTEKLDVLCTLLCGMPEYTDKNKVDIGCGSGIQALRVKNYLKGWADRWTGFDLSENAVKWAKNNNLNVIYADFIKYEHKDKYDVFLLLDSLEHIEDMDRLIETIKKTANKGFKIFGNIPLYQSEHDGGFERKMDINVLSTFLMKCGCTDLWHKIYGIKGYPYMVFEGKSL